MKRSGLLLFAMVFLSGLFAYPVIANADTIFRPGPGLNDGTDNGSLNAGKDTLAHGSEPARNWGAGPYILGTPLSTCNPAEAKAYLQFDLSSLPADVQQVFLGVTHFSHTVSCYSNCNADFYFYPVSSPWNEMTLTHNNMPAERAAVYGPVKISFPNDFGTKEYDITETYRNWKNGSLPNHGLAIYSPTQGCNNAAVMFYVHSSDDPDESLRPYLRIIPSSLQAPKNLRYTLNGDIVTINWDPADGATGYKIALGFQPQNYSGTADVGGITQFGPISVAGIPPGTYYLAVKAYKGGQESGYSNEIAVTISEGAPIEKPENFGFTLDNNIITFRWDPSNGASGYKLSYGMAPGSYISSFDLGGVTQMGPISIADVPAGTYYIAVKAYDGGRESGYSNEAIVTVKGTLTTSGSADLSSGSITSDGGIIVVDKPGDPLNGLTIEVPAGAFPEAKTFNVTARPVTGHNFGGNVNLISPLISINYGGGYAGKMMRVKIPVAIPAGHFAMAFYYDAAAGVLEGIPLVDEDGTSVTIATRHFSDIVVSSIPDSFVGTNVSVQTGFKPGTDDWQFTNYGSLIAPGGHCAGQSITSMWYYTDKARKGASHLYGLYDNNGDAATPSVWQDDTLGYRFASTIQEDVDWDNMWDMFGGTLNFEDSREDLSWKAFVYSMMVTREPQFVVIFNTSQGGGHAMVAYGAENGQLLIADPNYPGNLNRRISYGDRSFSPYNSGANAKEIAAGNGKEYDWIRYAGKRAIVPWEDVSDRWEEVESGTIGNDRFPDCTLKMLKTDGTLEDVVNDMVVDNKDYVEFQAFCNSNSFFPDWAGGWASVWIFRDEARQTSAATTRAGVDLEEGGNSLGFYLNYASGASDVWGSWTDFKDYNIILKKDIETQEFGYAASFKEQYGGGDPDWNLTTSGTVQGPPDFEMVQDAGNNSWPVYRIKGKRGAVSVIMDGTIDVVPSAMAGTLKYSSGLTCDWSYSDPLLIVYDGYSDTEISGNAFHFVCDTYNCGRYACVTYMLVKTCFDDKGNPNEINSTSGRGMRGCVGFDIEGYD